MVYAHCISGSRMEALSYCEALLSCGIGLFAFDFAGAGLSDGEYVHLSCEETGDLAAALHYLRNCGLVSHIALWGRR